eukprot:2921670-Rhodomonas_salina.1
MHGISAVQHFRARARVWCRRAWVPERRAQPINHRGMKAQNKKRSARCPGSAGSQAAAVTVTVTVTVTVSVLLVIRLLHLVSLCPIESGCANLFNARTQARIASKHYHYFLYRAGVLVQNAEPVSSDWLLSQRLGRAVHLSRHGPGPLGCTTDSAAVIGCRLGSPESESRVTVTVDKSSGRVLDPIAGTSDMRVATLSTGGLSDDDGPSLTAVAVA